MAPCGPLLNVRSNPESSTSATALRTSNDHATFSAAFQLSSPGWLAVTVTSPAPVNLSAFPSSTAGPSTLYPTANPLLAAASSATTFVATCAPISANSIVCRPCAITKVPSACPSQIASSTTAATAWLPAAVGASPVPSYVTATFSPVGTVSTPTAFASPSYSLSNPVSDTPATALRTSNDTTTGSAACQSPSPSWRAITATVPAPVKRNTFPGSSSAGPVTENSTGKSELADAHNSTTFVATCGPMAGNVISCTFTRVTLFHHAGSVSMAGLASNTMLAEARTTAPSGTSSRTFTR